MYEISFYKTAAGRSATRGDGEVRHETRDIARRMDTTRHIWTTGVLPFVLFVAFAYASVPPYFERTTLDGASVRKIVMRVKAAA